MEKTISTMLAQTRGKIEEKEEVNIVDMIEDNLKFVSKSYAHKY